MVHVTKDWVAIGEGQEVIEFLSRTIPVNYFETLMIPVGLKAMTCRRCEEEDVRTEFHHQQHHQHKLKKPH